MLNKLTLFAFAACLLIASSARALVTTESATFGPVSIGSPSFDLTLHKFDPSLGTLTAVTFTLDAATTGSSLAFDNQGNSPGSVTLKVGANVKAMTGVSLITEATTTPIQAMGTGSVQPENDAGSDFGPTDGFRISGGTGSGSAFQAQNTAPYLMQFTASGPGHTYVTHITNSIFTNMSTTAGVFGLTDTTRGTFSGKVTVAYTYSPVLIPEASGALWGACLALFAGLLRVRTRHA
ncbi:MAG TPA: choice-of-anchor E domain-containing protein [Chthoniobacteraceae bacterium]|nr:choice-of-anchor E domain-containing protein [Chthoniobacteraceae bacterium]